MSKTFAIVSDSTCDLDKELRDRWDITYVHMNYVIDEKEYPASLDWEYHSAKDYYDMMRKGVFIRTTQVARLTFEEEFGRLAAEGKDILYISCSSALSGSIGLGNVIAKEMAEKYPDCKIRCVDSLISSLGQGELVMRAAKLRNDGYDVDKTADEIENIRLTMNQLGTVDSLEYLKRVGRVTASSAFFGNLFGIKPLLISDRIGQNFAVKKARGALNAKREMAAMIADYVINPEEQTLYISHADALESAEEFRDEIMKAAKFKDCYINYIGPIVGASVGPGTIIAYCYGKEVTVEGTNN